MHSGTIFQVLSIKNEVEQLLAHPLFYVLLITLRKRLHFGFNLYKIYRTVKVIQGNYG